MNALILTPDEVASEGKGVITRRERLQYLREFHSLVPERELPIAVFYGKRGQGRVERVAPDVIEVSFSLTEEPLARIPLILLCGACRPQTLKKILHTAASTGVEAVLFVGTERGEKSYLSSKELTPTGIEENCLKALDQTGDSLPPKVQVLPTLSAALELLPHEGTRFFGDTGEGALPLSKKRHVSSPVTIGIGPEAGWSEHERKLLLTSTFHPVSLGQRVMRVELAAPILIAQTLLLLEESSPEAGES